MEQRAWVGPDHFIGRVHADGKKIFYIKEGQKFIAGVHIINSGKTPAFNVKGFIKIEALKPGEKPYLPASVENVLLQRTSAVMQAGGSLKLDSTLANITPTKAEIESLIKGETIVHLFGEIIYDDAFKRHHYTRYCMYLLHDLQGFGSCPYYNETDDQQDHK